MAKNYFYGTTSSGEREKINVAYVTDASGNRKKLLKLYATDSTGKASLVYENVHNHNWQFLNIDGYDDMYHYKTYYCTGCDEHNFVPESHWMNFMLYSGVYNDNYHYSEYACAYCDYRNTVEESHSFSTTYESAEADGFPGSHYVVLKCACGKEDRSLDGCTYDIPDKGGLTGDLILGYYCVCGNYQAV